MVKEEVEYTLEELNCHNPGESTVKILASQAGRKPHEIIREYLLACAEEKNYIDIMLVGNKGSDFSSNDKDKYLGSVANAIITNTKLNVVFMP